MFLETMKQIPPYGRPGPRGIVGFMADSWMKKYLSWYNFLNDAGISYFHVSWHAIIMSLVWCSDKFSNIFFIIHGFHFWQLKDTTTKGVEGPPWFSPFRGLEAMVVSLSILSHFSVDGRGSRFS